jgi:hypothetical protein
LHPRNRIPFRCNLFCRNHHHFTGSLHTLQRRVPSVSFCGTNGETLWKTCARSGSSPAALCRMFRVGKKVVIGVAGQARGRPKSGQDRAGLADFRLGKVVPVGRPRANRSLDRGQGKESAKVAELADAQDSGGTT